jgi:hypothetical protein
VSGERPDTQRVSVTLEVHGVALNVPPERIGLLCWRAVIATFPDQYIALYVTSDHDSEA